MKRIAGVKRRATRWILRCKRGELTYLERLHRLDFLDLIFYHKCIYKLVDLDVTKFTSVVRGRTRKATSLTLFTDTSL
jgi:hypothetical protein